MKGNDGENLAVLTVCTSQEGTINYCVTKPDTSISAVTSIINHEGLALL